MVFTLQVCDLSQIQQWQEMFNSVSITGGKRSSKALWQKLSRKSEWSPLILKLHSLQKPLPFIGNYCYFFPFCNYLDLLCYHKSLL